MFDIVFFVVSVCCCDSACALSAIVVCCSWCCCCGLGCRVFCLQLLFSVAQHSSCFARYSAKQSGVYTKLFSRSSLIAVCQSGINERARQSQRNPKQQRHRREHKTTAESNRTNSRAEQRQHRQTKEKKHGQTTQGTPPKKYSFTRACVSRVCPAHLSCT